MTTVTNEMISAAHKVTMEQPQQEEPDLLAAYLYGFEKGKGKT